VRGQPDLGELHRCAAPRRAPRRRDRGRRAVHERDPLGANLSGADLTRADLSNVVKGNLADFTGAYYDADTLVDPAIDDSVMYYVVGLCPTNPNQYWIDSDRDGDGDTCNGAAPLPEPGVTALLAGAAMIAALARRRA